MHINAIGHSDVGNVREHNEDYFLLDRELQSYIVCDGMGGHAAGEVASELAANTTRNYLKQHKSIIENYDGSPQANTQLADLVKDAVLEACKSVYELAENRPGCKGMGTTLTLLLICQTRGVLAHVGDSRLYLQRDHKIYKLSVDHTLMAELMAQGVPQEELLKGRISTANILTRAIGKEPSVKVDILLFDVLAKDTFLLCSDGLSSVSNPTELDTMLSSQNLATIPLQLIGLAKKRDGSDNITALVVRCEPEQPQASQEQEWITEIQLRFETLQQIYIFHHVTFRELSKLMSVMNIVHYDAGETVIQEGSTSNQLYIVLEGKLSISRGKKEIRVLGSGDHVGEMALLSDQPRSATAITTEPTRLLMVERDDLFKLMREEPVIGVKLLWNLSRGLSTRLDATNLQMFGPIQIGQEDVNDTLRLTPIPRSEF